MSLSEERLREIEVRAKSATDGPWEAHEEDSGVLPEWAVWMPDAGHDGAMVEDKADAEFVAHARTDVPDLLAEVKRLRTGIEHLTRTGYDHTPDCVREAERDDDFWHPDCGRCWEDSLHALLNPTEGETSE